MKLFTTTLMGLVFGMAALALANPVMLPKHPGYPSRGEFANDTGRKNLTYSQSMEEAARSGDTTVSTVLIDPKGPEAHEIQVVEPLSKGAAEQPVKKDMRIQKK